jgi:hypothetical protein
MGEKHIVAGGVCVLTKAKSMQSIESVDHHEIYDKLSNTRLTTVHWFVCDGGPHLPTVHWFVCDGGPLLIYFIRF